MRLFLIVVSIINLFIIVSCRSSAKNKQQTLTNSGISDSIQIDTSYKSIHVFVALCDNKYQGIVPVPEKIGNGQDVKNNLYWATAFGVKTYFKNSKEWKLIRSEKKDSLLLERIVFQHVNKKYFLVADAYNGKNIKECTINFLRSCAAQQFDTLQINNKTIGTNGYATLVAYCGHDGLMDFQLENTFQNKSEKCKDAIILACISKKYFAPYLKSCNAKPLVWSTGLMSPEAYTLHDALNGYIYKESSNKIVERAAMAYAKYQKCSLNAAKKLLVSGW